MPDSLSPIQDDVLADAVVDQFLLGYDPLLYAADYGLQPEQVYDQLRWTIRVLRRRLARPTAGRKLDEEPSPNALRVRAHRARKMQS